MSKINLIAEEQRKKMLLTNLYTFDNVYNINNSAVNKVISTIGSNIIGGSFDFSNSILGRVLLPNTPIQQIGNRELTKALLQRVTSELKQNVIGSIDIRKGNINKPNFWSITNLSNDKNTSGFSKLLDTLFGYQTSTNPFLGDYSNEHLKNLRGDGVKNIYESNILNNKFNLDIDGKAYVDVDIKSKLGNINPPILGDIETKNKNLIITSLTDGYPNQNNTEAEIISNNLNIDAQAYNTKYHDVDGFLVYNPNSNNKSIVGKGSNVTSENPNKFCRSWTIKKGYTGYTQTMKFDNYKNKSISNMVQGDSIMPNIAPNLDLINKQSGNKYVKNLMFSIENLAYEGDGYKTLKVYEKGSKGRIMWFPPYGITLTESIIPKVNSIELIGRNEPMYTYNGVERDITLGFTMIVDTPSIIRNSEDTNNEFSRLFNGCKVAISNPQKGLSDEEKNNIELQIVALNKVEPPIEIIPPVNPYPIDKSIKYYYSNNSYVFNNNLNGPNEDNDLHTGKNSNIIFLDKVQELIKYISEVDGYENYKIIVMGYASSLADVPYNKVLAYKRAYSTYVFIRDLVILKKPEVFNAQSSFIPELKEEPKSRVPIKDADSKYFKLISYGESKATDTNSTINTLNEDVIDRFVEVYLEGSVSNKKSTEQVDVKVNEQKQTEINRLKDILEADNKGVKSPGSEHFFFETIKKEDPFMYSQYKEKIKHFNPVFHSQTPEDFNSRLNFLHQCSRQGVSQGNVVQNSIFGKPPVSILRLGDFIHTKIIITTISITYEPLIWDLNPEGIGIQPMLCQVTLSAHVIGGQSLRGPLNKLLNALDTNYYANTEVYDKRAFLTARAFSEDSEESKKYEKYLNQNNLNALLTQINELGSDKDQIAKLELSDMIESPLSTNTGAIMGDSEISYKTILESKVDVLNRWVDYFISLDERYFKYLNEGVLDIKVAQKDINMMISSLESNPLKNINEEIAIHELNKSLLDKSQDLKKIYIDYITNNNLSTIRITNKDNEKILTVNDELNKFKVIVSDLNIVLVDNIYVINSKSFDELNKLKDRLIKIKKSIDLLGKIKYTVPTQPVTPIA